MNEEVNYIKSEKLTCFEFIIFYANEALLFAFFELLNKFCKFLNK